MAKQTELKIASMLVGFAACSPAHACMTYPPPQAVLFDIPPSEIPPGHFVIRIRSRLNPPFDRPLRLRVIDARKSLLLPSYVNFEPERYSSCTQWGRTGEEAFAVVAKSSGNLLIAKVYQRSWLDAIFHLLDISRFHAAGSAVWFPPRQGLGTD